MTTITRRQMLAGVGAGLVLPVSGAWSGASAAPVSAKFSGPYLDPSDNANAFYFLPALQDAKRDSVLALVVHASGGRPGDLEAVTVGDVPATIDAVLRGPGNDVIAFASAPLPAAGDETFVSVKLATPHDRCVLGVWALSGVAGKPTVVQSEFRRQDSAGVTVSVPDGGLCICAFQGAATKIDWSGATPVYEETVETYLSIGGAVAVDNATITATPRRVPNECGLLAAIWT